MPTEIWGNNSRDLLMALGLFFAALITLLIFKFIVFRKIKKFAETTKTQTDDFVLAAVEKNIFPILYCAAIFVAVHSLSIPERFMFYISAAFKVLIIIQAVRFFIEVLIFMLKGLWLEPGEAAQGASKGIFWVVRLAVWAVAIIFILDNLGFDVNSVIAGLGIGGVAVALAVQTILGDLFNYFVIFFDKPFKEGDTITVGEFSGVIEHIGIKSTRIRSQSGELLIFSNSDLTSSRVRNFMNMQRRRVQFTVGVVYNTPRQKLEKIPGTIKSIIESMKDTAFDRSHFHTLGSFSLDVETVYFVLTPDYVRYMDIQQQINLKIIEKFAEEGIEFAYPTQTVLVNKNS